MKDDNALAASTAFSTPLTNEEARLLKDNRGSRRGKLAQASKKDLLAEELRRLEVIYRDPHTLAPNARNARTHGERQIVQLIAAIREFGFTNPIIIDEDLVVIAGHARLQAALRLKLAEVPTISIVGLSAQKKRALMLADNKIALNAGWDIEMLREELIVLTAPELDLTEALGFTTAESEGIIANTEGEDRPDPADHVDAIDRSVPSITRVGDLWILGDHKILCADALLADSYERLMGMERAQQVLSDPPWNLAASIISGMGKVKHQNFAMASGEMTADQFIDFLKTAIGHMVAFSQNGTILMLFIDWRHIWDLISAARALGLELKNICVWDKGNGGMGSLYRSQHELIGIFKSGTADHINNIELGKHGRYRTNIWSHAGANSFRKGRRQDLASHPTVKPVGLLVDAIRDCSTQGGIILDPFGGSGSTLLAAERTGRRARLMELDPWYVDVAVQRWEQMTGRQAVLSAPARDDTEL